MAWMEVEIDLDVLASQFANELSNSTLLDFVMKLDEQVGELDFTVQLRDQLNKVIEDEA